MQSKAFSRMTFFGFILGTVIMGWRKHTPYPTPHKHRVPTATPARTLTPSELRPLRRSSPARNSTACPAAVTATTTSPPARLASGTSSAQLHTGASREEGNGLELAGLLRSHEKWEVRREDGMGGKCLCHGMGWDARHDHGRPEPGPRPGETRTPKPNLTEPQPSPRESGRPHNIRHADRCVCVVLLTPARRRC